MNVVRNPGFEDATDWSLSGGASYSTDAAKSGSQSMFLLSSHFFFGQHFYTESEAAQDIAGLQPGRIYQFSAWVQNSLQNPTRPLRLRLDFGDGAVTEMAYLDAASTTEWTKIEAMVTAADSDARLLVDTPRSGAIGNDWWYVDDISLTGSLVMAGTLKTFLNNLVTVIQGADPNIGKVFIGHPRWRTIKELHDDAAFAVAGSSLIDSPPRIGKKVTRLWLVEPMTEGLRLTNGTSEYRHTIRIRGFFQYEDGDAQEATLIDAATLVLGALFTNEKTGLAAGLGGGYEGFLLDPPRWESAPQHAQLGALEVLGYTVDMTMNYFEEVTH